MDNLKNIFARNCIVKRITKPEAADFLNRYHRLGDTTCRYRYGLFTKRTTGAAEASIAEGTLVAVATFSNARRWDKDGHSISSYEWIRYASLSGIRVTGGMGKLLQAFIEDVHPDDIMTYADLSWPDGGEVYRTLGFKKEDTVERGGHTNVKYRLRIDGSHYSHNPSTGRTS
ncbi:MAG: hypothetical protein MJY89_07285 [Bacteroidales bacterium]|nr:hypothetical protein [Bacteroidales bacterium]